MWFRVHTLLVKSPLLRPCLRKYLTLFLKHNIMILARYMYIRSILFTAVKVAMKRLLIQTSSKMHDCCHTGKCEVIVDHSSVAMCYHPLWDVAIILSHLCLRSNYPQVNMVSITSEEHYVAIITFIRLEHSAKHTQAWHNVRRDYIRLCFLIGC